MPVLIETENDGC